VESDIARAIAENLQAKLTGSAEQVLASKPTENPQAHELYLRGRYFWNRRTGENLKKAADYFQQAIGKDPRYALAYSGLADCHVLLPVYPDLGSNPRDELPQALSAARKAVQLDDTLAEAQQFPRPSIGLRSTTLCRVSEFNRAIELNPNYATAHQWFGECLQSQDVWKRGWPSLSERKSLIHCRSSLTRFWGSRSILPGKAMRQSRTAQNDRDRSELLDCTLVLWHVLEHKGQLKERL